MCCHVVDTLIPIAVIEIISGKVIPTATRTLVLRCVISRKHLLGNEMSTSLGAPKEFYSFKSSHQSLVSRVMVTRKKEGQHVQHPHIYILHTLASVKEDLNVDRQNAQTAETSNPKPSVVPIRVAFSGRQEETVLHTVRVSSTDTGEEVMKKLRAQNQEHRSKISAFFEAFMRASVMQRIAVQVVTVSPVSIPVAP